MSHSLPTRLSPELVPEPLWGLSAYRLLGRGSKWKRIREDALRVASNRCSVCGDATNQLQCNEQWRYDDKRGIAELIAFVILCHHCHLVTHMGRAIAHGYGDQALSHLAAVNGVTHSQAKAIVAEAMRRWRARSSRSWKVAVAQGLLDKYPQLVVLVDQKRG